MDITKVLNKIKLDDTGKYENHFYVINFADSDEYSKIYTQLDEKAINTEYPSFETNTNKSTTKVINYFTIDVDNITYDLMLFADFDNDKYYLKISEAV